MFRPVNYGVLLELKNNKVKMAEVKIYKTSEKVLIWLYRTNRTQVWLGEQLGVTRQAINGKLADNSFTAGDIMKLSQMGCPI